MTPEKVVLELFPPTVRVGVPVAELVITPLLAPAIDPAETEKPARSKVPSITYAELLESAPVLPALKVEPTFIVVAPLYELLPLKIKGALLESVTCPVPEIALGKVTALVWVKVTNPLLVIAVALVGAKPAIASL